MGQSVILVITLSSLADKLRQIIPGLTEPDRPGGKKQKKDRVKLFNFA